MSLQSQERIELWSWCFACLQTWKSFKNWYYYFRWIWPVMGKFAMPLCYGILRKKPGIKLGAISNTVSNIALTIYNTPNVLPPLILSLSQYGIHTKPFLHLINCLFNLRSLVLFQVTIDQLKLAYFTSFPQYLVLVSLTLSSKSLWYSSLIHLWLMFPFYIWKYEDIRC